LKKNVVRKLPITKLNGYFEPLQRIATDSFAGNPGAAPPVLSYVINLIAPGAQHFSCTEGGPLVLVAVRPADGGSGPCAGRL